MTGSFQSQCLLFSLLCLFSFAGACKAKFERLVADSAAGRLEEALKEVPKKQVKQLEALLKSFSSRQDDADAGSES